jgi:hypothetical protein
VSYTTRPPSFENLEEPQLSAAGVTECNDFSGYSDFSGSLAGEPDPSISAHGAKMDKNRRIRLKIS